MYRLSDRRMVDDGLGNSERVEGCNKILKSQGWLITSQGMGLLSKA